MSKSHAVLKFTRKVHLLLGIFTTPALLFFAFTGAMQTFSLHETTQGSAYKPPAWIASLAQLHKKQDTTVPVRKLRPPAIDGGERGNLGSALGASASDAAEQSAPGQASKKADGSESRSGGPAPVARKSHLPMKIFFLLVSVSLALSTLTGAYMSYKFNRRPWQLTGLLVAGLVVPLLLLPF